MLSKHCLFFGLFVCSFNPHKNSLEKMIPFFEKTKKKNLFGMGFGWKPPTFSTWPCRCRCKLNTLVETVSVKRNHPFQLEHFLRKQQCVSQQKAKPNGTKIYQNFAPWGVSSLYLYAVYCVILACAILLADKTGQRRRVPRLRIWLKMWGSG